MSTGRANRTGSTGVALHSVSHPGRRPLSAAQKRQLKTSGSLPSGSLSEKSLEEAIIEINRYVEDRGLKFAIRPTQLLPPKWRADLELRLARIRHRVISERLAGRRLVNVSLMFVGPLGRRRRNKGGRARRITRT